MAYFLCSSIARIPLDLQYGVLSFSRHCFNDDFSGIRERISCGGLTLVKCSVRPSCIIIFENIKIVLAKCKIMVSNTYYESTNDIKVVEYEYPIHTNFSVMKG